MILRFFRKDLKKPMIDGLYARTIEASRHEGLYRDLGVPDTVEGRFEALVLHLILVLRRMRALPPPAAEIAQDLVDKFFREMDITLRASGVSDLGVPKRMKKLAQSFYGRAQVYDAALDSGNVAALAEALERNIYDNAQSGGPLALYVVASERQLLSEDLETLLERGPRFPPPDRLPEGG